VDPGFGIGLVVLWVLLNLLGRRKKTSNQGTRPPVTLPRSTGADPTQREGARLHDFLRELSGTLDEAAGPRGRPASGRLPPAEEVEERGSLETTTSPEARSLEEGVRRPERTVVDADDEAEAIAARRIAAAEANARSLTKVDHQAFDARIRQEPADAAATRGYSMGRLRNAVVWREVLGPPLALREGDER
jgi:hypothetical protein